MKSAGLITSLLTGLKEFDSRTRNITGHHTLNVMSTGFVSRKKKWRGVRSCEKYSYRKSKKDKSYWYINNTNKKLVAEMKTELRLKVLTTMLNARQNEVLRTKD